MIQLQELIIGIKEERNPNSNTETAEMTIGRITSDASTAFHKIPEQIVPTYNANHMIHFKGVDKVHSEVHLRRDWKAENSEGYNHFLFCWNSQGNKSSKTI
jgi:hypothetical protein